MSLAHDAPNEGALSKGSPLMILSRLPIAIVASVALISGCSAASADDTATTTQNQNESLLPTGTYKLAGSPEAWTIKELVLAPGGKYTVVMYPGRAFPIDDTVTTTGKYSVSDDTLTIRFEKGNVFERWSVEKRGDNLHFTDLEETSEFDMTYEGGDTSDPTPDPVKGVDPGMPSSVSGGVEIHCHSGYGDIYANLSVARSGVGRLKLSSSDTLGLSQVESVTLKHNPDSANTPGWLSVTGDGNSADGKRYIFQLPTSFLDNGGDEGITMTVGSQDEDNAEEREYGMNCTASP
jgi:hypothetical protein